MVEATSLLISSEKGRSGDEVLVESSRLPISLPRRYTARGTGGNRDLTDKRTIEGSS